MKSDKIDTAVINLTAMRRLTNFDTEKMQTVMHSFEEPLPEFEDNYHLGKDIYQGLAFYDSSMGQSFESEFDQFNFVRWHEYSVDVVPKESSKAVTMLKFAEKFDVSVENIVAVGDGLNDLEMIQSAGVGIAMGNAQPEVKGVVDFLTKSNDENGIWFAFKELNFL